MNKVLFHFILLGLCSDGLFGANGGFGALPDPFTGNWSGSSQEGATAEPLFATVIERKKGYEVIFRRKPIPRTKAIVMFSGQVEGDRLTFEPALSENRTDVIEVQDRGVLIETLLWEGKAVDGNMTGSFAGRAKGRFKLQKDAFQPSPTLGKRAPANAVVLFDGGTLDAWEPRRTPDETIQWEVTPSGFLKVVSHRNGERNKQDLSSRESFGDYFLHLEFNLNHKPSASGQGRSNSGIFHLGLYETQILDSFGLYGRDNECGGIYKTREPDSNAVYPAGLWQTYDIEVRAPRFDTEGVKTANARMTVRLNGVLIHDDVEVPKPTAGGKEAEKGPIVLQDHGNPVQFRNIWVVKK